MERADGVRAGRVHGTGPPPGIFSWRVSLGAMGLCAGPLPHHLPLISAMYAVRQRSPARPNGELIRFGPEAECGQGAQQWKEANGTRFAQPPPPSSAALLSRTQLWHVDCFRCAKCHNKVTTDRDDILLLSDGHPICGQCNYCCQICGLPIMEEAIMTGE